MKLIDITIPLGIQTLPWPTYEPLLVKYFKRLAPNGANGQLIILFREILVGTTTKLDLTRIAICVY